MIAAVFATLLTQQPPLRFCTASPKRSIDLQWSRAAALTSPDRSWSIELTPDIKGENNNSTLALINCKTMTKTIIARITRKAYANWEPRSKELLLVTEPSAGDMILEYFKIGTNRSAVVVSKSDAPNRALTAELVRMMPPGYKLSFRIIRLETFDNNQITLLSSGVFDKKNGGASIPYCARFTISTIGHVERINKITTSIDNLSDKCDYYP
ncbi:hypothetical protein U1769_21130 [Sphingomonas sp. ZT3P38]|uniref:hypothetical protein n=1 Tax=Parasphingomonas zepuensis TaxID=3096161 RepID=UPI002FC900E6